MEDDSLGFGVDLVSAARKNLGLFKTVADNHWLHQDSAIAEAIRRYDEVWMPLLAHLSTGPNPPLILPPLDVEWVWFCHSLDPADYKQYCDSRFSKLISKTAIFDEENREYALNRSKRMWEAEFPAEPFEAADADDDVAAAFPPSNRNLSDRVSKQTEIYYKRFSEPYYSEKVYLIAARRRYRDFIRTVAADECRSRFVPTSDILLMWITHQSYPKAYAAAASSSSSDIDGAEKIIGNWWDDDGSSSSSTAAANEEEDVEKTELLWDRAHHLPYEKAGAAVVRTQQQIIGPPFYWETTDSDVNTKYTSLKPRFFVEVCISVKLVPDAENAAKDFPRLFSRVRIISRELLKMDRRISDFTSESWRKAYHLYAEFGTRGLTLELRRSKQQRPFSSGRGSSLRQSMSFTWNDLLRAPSLSSCKEFNNGRLMRVHASITPPVEASYLLRCVPDRVTDDSGAMISDVYLKMNRHRPQSGRWLTRTVVDHAARECFVIRMRVGVGFWRWGGEVPKAVGREDRIIEIRQGTWSYVYGSTSIGRAPEKIVGTATPREPPEGYQFSWSFSTRNELFMQWDHPPSSPSVSALRLQFKTSSSEKTTVELLPGRQRQYRVRKPNPETAPDEDDGFITMIRFSDESPYGKATALLNWKHLVVDYLPEEDTVLVLLLCLAILRGISVMKREDVGNLLMRRRVQVSPDCGSVILHPSSQPPHPPPCAQPWYWNPNSVMAAAQEKGHFAVAASSPVEGSDELYRTGIIQ